MLLNESTKNATELLSNVDSIYISEKFFEMVNEQSCDCDEIVIKNGDKYILLTSHSSGEDGYIEINTIANYAQSKFLYEVDISKDKWDDNTIYYYCKQYREKEDSNFLEKLQSLAGMSRSFTVYFICMFVISMFILFYNLFTQQDINILQYIVPFATMILSIIFYLRFIRFIVMRYTKIYRGFLYSKIMKKA